MRLIGNNVRRSIADVTLTLYHSVESTCAQKVRLVLAEKHLAWDEVRLNLRKGDQFEADYLKLNPKAVVPTLVDGKTIVRESTVINEYLDDAYPQVALKPTAPPERARMRLLIKAFDDEVHPAIGILSYAIFLRHQMNELKSAEELTEHFRKVTDPMRRERQMRTHEQGLDSPTVPIALANLAKVIKLVDDVLRLGDWLAGTRFSLTDAATVPYMVRAEALGLAPLWSHKPQIGAWLARTLEHAGELDLDETWGSASFAEMVAGYASAESEKIGKLIAEVEPGRL